MPAAALAVLDEPTTKLALVPTPDGAPQTQEPEADRPDELDHQLTLLAETLADRIDRIRGRLNLGDPPGEVLDDVAHLLLAAAMTSPAENPLHALAVEAAAALLYAAQQPEPAATGADL